ncbi:MAG: hypothetical protein DMG40_02420 [Acidobacteria bacterium]|nr:MAG: hypothetical protein DMG40_02420 [Acidobacteriota bacterium]
MYIRDAWGRQGLKAKAYSAREEKRILAALGRSLLRDFPNPERIGCPGPEVVKRIASHEMDLSEADKWLDHLTSCSPCYRDLSAFQTAYRRRRRGALGAIAAAIVMVACFAGWALFLRPNGPLVRRQKEPSAPRQEKPLATQTAVLDLRDRSPQRGAEPALALPPLEMAPNVSHLEIYLPLGSDEGLYDVRVTTTQGELLLAATGRAKIKQGLTSMAVDVPPSTIRSGKYILKIGTHSWEWVFPLVVR